MCCYGDCAYIVALLDIGRACMTKDLLWNGCILCGKLCDYSPTGFCVNCLTAVNRTNERVMLLSLLKEAAHHCPVGLQRKIEAVLEIQMPAMLEEI